MSNIYGKVYKAWAVNLDRENKIEINVKEETEEIADQAPDVAKHQLALEEMAASAQSKADAGAKLVLDKAKNEAGTIIGQARIEAEQMRKEATLAIEKERASILLEAEKKGYSEGHQKGENAAQAIVDEANSLKTETYSQREEAIKSLEPELVDLIIRICRKLVSDSLHTNPQVILHLIRQGLAQSNFTGDVTLRVSKEDYDNVISNKEALMESVEGGAELLILKDFGLGLGDCVIETPFGVIDSSLDMQFEEIRESLRLILEGDLMEGAV